MPIHVDNPTGSNHAFEKSMRPAVRCHVFMVAEPPRGLIADVAGALVEASHQSTEMAQEAVKMLKEVKEKGEKKDGEGFATASKVVSVFAEEAYNKELATIEGSEEKVKLRSVIKEEQVRAEKLYAILVGLLRNRPLALLWAVVVIPAGAKDQITVDCFAPGLRGPSKFHEGQGHYGVGAAPWS